MFSLCDPEAALLPAHPGDHGGIVLGVVEKVPDEDVQRGDGHLQMDKVAVNQNSCITDNILNTWITWVVVVVVHGFKQRF